MEVYGYSHKTKDEFLELYEVTLREIAKFLSQCAEGIEKNGSNWNHEHFSPSNESTTKDGPEFVVFNPDAG